MSLLNVAIAARDSVVSAATGVTFWEVPSAGAYSSAGGGGGGGGGGDARTSTTGVNTPESEALCPLTLPSPVPSAEPSIGAERSSPAAEVLGRSAIVLSDAGAFEVCLAAEDSDAADDELMIEAIPMSPAHIRATRMT